MEEPSLQVAGALGLISSTDFREHSSVALLPAQENQACEQGKFWGLIFCMGFWEFSGTASG
jgi:hypothetical protein